MEIKSVEAAYIGASLMTDGAIPVLEGRMFYTPLWRDCRDSGIRDLSLLLAEFDEHKDEITALQVLYSKPYKQQLQFQHITKPPNHTR